MGKTMIDELLKPEILRAGDGESEIRFRSQPQLTIPGGVMQGGIITAMLDMAMAIAANGALSTASIHVEIYRPVTADEVTVSAGITKKGRRIVFAEATMRDSEGRTLAKGTQTAVPIESTDTNRRANGAF